MYFRFALTALLCAYFWHYAATYTAWHFIDNVNLIFHEAGHTIFSFFGTFIRVAAGSGFQVALPAFFSWYFFKTEQRISGALCLAWVGQNLLNVSVYAGDAVRMQLPLLGGDASGHDWHYLLGTLGLLGHTAQVAAAFFAAGLTLIFLGSFLSLSYSSRESPRRF